MNYHRDNHLDDNVNHHRDNHLNDKNGFFDDNGFCLRPPHWRRAPNDNAL